MPDSGIVLSVNISGKKGEKKVPVDSILITDRGIEGDAHAGDWHRQVSLLAEESIDKMRGKGIEIEYGDFAENITIRGIEFENIAVGQKIKIGTDVVLEVSQIGKECHSDCQIRKAVGDCVMPREGLFTKVISGGNVRPGDAVEFV